MTSNFVFLGAFVVSVILIMGTALIFKAFRKRNRKRSPLHGKKLANLPGQQLMKRANDHSDEMMMALVIAYFSVPTMLGAWAINKVDWSNVHFGIAEGIFLAGALAMSLYGMSQFIKHSMARSRAEDGLVAEQMTGQLLNRLVGPSCLVAHDLPCEGFNIDHIVIAPRGVFAIETKSFRKRHRSEDDSHYKVSFDGHALQFSGWRETEAIEQARRQAQWLSRYLRDCLDREIPVIPALSIPGWWIDTTEAGRKSDVKVFTPMGRGAQFLTAGNEAIDASTRSLIAQAIAQKYPRVDA